MSKLLRLAIAFVSGQQIPKEATPRVLPLLSLLVEGVVG
jgi:hypothetical protein